MFFNRIDAKREAQRLIREHQPSPIRMTLIYLLLTSGVNLVIGFFLSNPFDQIMTYIAEGYDPMMVYAYVFGGSGAIIALFVNILMRLYQTVMAFGYSGFSLKVIRGEQGSVEDLFEGFGLVMKVIVLNLLMTILATLWSMMFIIPGIIAIYSYSQAVYCLLEDPEISPMEAIRRSRAMMRGHKWELFVVQISFFGWILGMSAVTMLMGGLAGRLGPVVGTTVTVVVGMLCDLWLLPYENLTFAQFYRALPGAGQHRTGPRVEF